MSLYELINKGAGSFAPAWSRLKIRSLEVDTITVVNPPVDSVKNIFVSSAGSDSANGLTALTPVLTMVKAIEIAANYSAIQCIINVSGTVGIGTSPAPDNTGFDKVLDFSALSQNYQLIEIIGEREDEEEFAAGVATHGAASPWDKWTTLSGLSGLTSSAYTKGILHKKDGATQDLYCCAIGNSTTAVTAATNEGTAIALDGFELYNVGGSMLYDNSKYVIASEIPIIFRDMAIQGPTSEANFILSLVQLQFYGCKFISQAIQGFMLGELYLYGCVVEASSNADTVFRRDAKVDAMSVNFQNVSERFTLSRNWEDVHGVDCSISFYSSNSTIFRMKIDVDGTSNDVSPLIVSDSSLTIISGVVTLDAGSEPAVYMVASMLYSREGLDVQKYTSGADSAIFCEDSCILKINGDCIVVSEGLHAIQLQNSKFTLTPGSGATPYNLIESTSQHAILANRDSSIILNQQATKNVYGIVSAAKEAVAIADSSKLIVIPAYANGPNFSSPSTFAMIKNTYSSKVILGNASYVNAGAGTSKVLNGTIVTDVSPAGAATDIVAGAGATITANSQNCYVIIK